MAWDRQNGRIQRTGYMTPAVADPGDAGAIDATVDGVCALVSAGAETRTLADPSFLGQTLDLACDTHGGDIAVTVAHAFDQTPHTTITFTAAGQHARLGAVTVGGSMRWRLIANNGATLA